MNTKRPLRIVALLTACVVVFTPALAIASHFYDYYSPGYYYDPYYYGGYEEVVVYEEVVIVDQPWYTVAYDTARGSVGRALHAGSGLSVEGCTSITVDD